MRQFATTRQRDLLRFIRQFRATNGYSPTIREMCVALGVNSANAAHELLTRLSRDGLVIMAETATGGLRASGAARCTLLTAKGESVARLP